MLIRHLARALGFAALAVGAAASTSLALAQTGFPNRPVKVIVPSTAGGPLDTVVRAMSGKLAELLGQPVVVENKPGAGTNIGSEFVARAPADGYTILSNTLSMTVNPALYGNLPFDPLRDFAPITQAVAVTNLLVVHPDLPITSVRELVDYGHRNPDKLAAGTGGIGVAGHMAAELFKRTTRTKMVVVPYKGAAPAVNDLLGGQISMLFEAAIVTLPHVQTGRFRALAVTTARRSTLLPDLPTVAEGGLPGYEATNWYGFFAPAGTPKAVIDRLHHDLIQTLHDPGVRQKLNSMGAEVIGNSPQEFAENMKTETEKWRVVIREAGMRVE
ncbi:MAG: tripartite tricarboxylate transporter substrate binding protein [Lautropia sp.]